MSLKRKISICLSFIDRGIEFLIVAAFFVMVIVGGLQVFNRYIVGQSLSWSEEFQKFTHVWIIFLAVPLAYKRGSHIGMNVVYDKFPAKIKSVIDVLIDVLWFCLGGVMIFYTLRIMKVARMQTSPGLGIRMDWVYLCIILGGIYLCLVAIQKICGHFRKFNVKEQVD